MASPLQKLVFHAGSEVFGQDSTMDPRERLMRFYEEATELVRAGGLSLADCENIQRYEFSRPIEPQIRKEIAGAGVTLFAVATVFGESLEEVVGNECKRILNEKDRCREKHAQKPDDVISKRVAA